MQDSLSLDLPDPSGGAAGAHPATPPAPGLGAPLAERLRPRTIDEVVGQDHLLGPGQPVRVAFESGQPHSMILWGPPGVGKTTLARLMAQVFDALFISISAVLGGVKDIRDAVERAQLNRAQSQRGTVVFVDEVHRFNKAQQDAFLPHVESGLFVFIGADADTGWLPPEVQRDKSGYVLTGDEPLLLQEASDALRRAASAQGYGERERHGVERGFDWNDLLAGCQSLSLFAERKLLELRFSGKPDASAAER